MVYEKKNGKYKPKTIVHMKWFMIKLDYVVRMS